MKENKSCCIIIPTHKDYNKLSEFERKSLQNTISKMNKYDIVIVCSESTNIDSYRSAGISNFAQFNNKFFTSVSSYCDLVLSSFFYESFKEYEYMLIAQLDSYIFEDRLEEFIELGYDYIGSLHYTPHTGNKLINGNGGFCLRKIDAFIEASKHIREDLNGKRDWEDILYSYWYKDKMNIAPDEVSLRFGWQQEPQQCYERNGRKLPFGAHKPHIFGKNFDVFKEIIGN